MAETLTLSRGFNHLGEIAKTVGDLRGVRTVIHELVQNADDAGARQMRFVVDDDALEVWNDADFKRCPDITTPECEWLRARGHRCDFHSLRNIGSGDKRNRPGTTGAFGIGFMAVYQLTDRPELLSSGEHWIIDEMAREDRRISRRPAPADHKGTTFRLPWARQLTEFRKKIRQEAVPDVTIARFFIELDEALPRAMPFLRNLHRIEIINRGQRRSFKRSTPSQRVVVESSAGARWTWLVLQSDFAGAANDLKARHPDQIEEARSADVTVAFPLDQYAEAGILYASLPTEESSHLPLLINADFYPASDRKRIRFDDAPESDFNRAAITAASQLIAAELERLPDLLGDARLIGLLIRAQDLSRRTANEHIDGSFKAFWSDIADVLPDVPVVPAATGGRQRSKSVRLWREPAELNAAPFIADIGVLLLHPDHKDGWYQLRSHEIGLQELSLGDITTGLQNAGITRRSLVDQMPGKLGTRDGLAGLHTVIELLLSSSGRANQETRRALLGCAIAPGSDDAYWPFDVLHVADPQTRSVLANAGLTLTYLDTQELGLDNAQLIGLVPAIDAAQALDMLEEAAAARTLSRSLDSGPILEWFAHREADLDEKKTARLTRLPIFPTAAGPMALTGLALPGDFTDPLGIARIIAVDTIQELRPFLRKLGARPLTFALYCTNFVPEAVTDDHVDGGRRRKLTDLLAARWSQIRDDDEARKALGPLSIVPCSDRVWRPAGQVYIASEELKAILGSQVNFAAFLPGQRDAYEDLYLWLGAASEPRPADLITRCYQLISAPPGHRQTGEAIVRHLGRRYRNEPAAVEQAYAKLKDIGWLPYEGGQSRGMRPEAVYTVFRKKLFESQGSFLDIPKPVQEDAAGFLSWLGVKTMPEPKLVVDHLLWCSGHSKEVSEDVWIYLDQHAADSALDALLSQPCLLLDNGTFVRPADVYWGEHPFGRWRYRLGPKFRSRQALLDRLGVAQVPTPKDAIDVLQDIAANHGGEAAPLLAADIPVVQNCWQLLSTGLASGDVELAELRHLIVDEVVLDARNWLRTPADAFFRDSVSLAARFDSSLQPRLIERPEKVWPALAAAGVRNLSDAVTTHVVEAEGDSPQGQAGERLRSRRILLLRVLGHDPHATANLDDFYATVQIRHLARLEIQQSLEVGCEHYSSAPYPRGALYLPKDNDLLCVEQADAPPTWVEVARELVRALHIDSGQPSALASAIKVVLEASTAEDAALELDELGFPALDPLIVAPVKGSVAEGLGGTPVEDSGKPDDDAGRPPEAEDLQEPARPCPMPRDGSNIGETAAPNTTPRGDHTGSPADGTSPGTDHGSGDRPKKAGQERSSEGVQSRLRTYVAPARPGTLAATANRSENDDAVERACVDAVLTYEQEHGREPAEMPPTNPGFDIRSLDPDGVVRIIEVKATAGRWAARGVGLSNTQFITAQQRREEYWLYVVENALSNPRVHPINDPASKVDQYLFDDGWRALSASETAPRSPLEPLNLISATVQGAVPYFDPGNPRTGEPDAADGWLACADAGCREGWFAVRITGYGLGLAFYGGVAYVEPIHDAPDDGEHVLVLLHNQLDPDSGTRYSLRRWSPERDLAGHQLALRLTSDGSAEPLTVLAPDQAKVIGRVRVTVRAADIGRGQRR